MALREYVAEALAGADKVAVWLEESDWEAVAGVVGVPVRADVSVMDPDGDKDQIGVGVADGVADSVGVGDAVGPAVGVEVMLRLGFSVDVVERVEDEVGGHVWDPVRDVDGEGYAVGVESWVAVKV